MKIAFVLLALVSVVFAAPSSEYAKTIKRNRGNNVRLVCENGYCVLKTAEDSSSQETPVEKDEYPSMTTASKVDQKEDKETNDIPEGIPVEHSTEIIEDVRGDQSVHGDETPMIITHEESMHDIVTEQIPSENDEIHIVENHDSDEQHDSDEHRDINEHEDDLLARMTIPENQSSVPQQEESSDEDHEDHTLSTELKPPHVENVWNLPTVSSEEDSSVVYKIPQDERRYTKGGVKGGKIYY